MNTNGMDYSYSPLDVPFTKTLEKLLTKAVRVTTAVEEKIKKAFISNFTVKGIENQQVELVNKMVNQVKIEESKPVEAIPVVESKPMDVVEQENYLVSKTVNEANENIRILLDKIEQLERQKKAVATVKRIALYTKELANLTFAVAKKWFVNFNKIESVADAVTPIVMSESPSPTVTSTSVPTLPVEPTPEPTPVPVTNINSFSWDDILKGATPKQEVTSETPIKGVNDFNFAIPTFEQKVQTEVVTPAITAEAPSFEFFPGTSKSNVLPFEKSKDTAVEFIAVKEQDAPTRTAIAARIYRFTEEVRAANEEKKRLKAELEAVKTEKASIASSAAAYEKVNRDMASKMISLTEQLSTANAELDKAKELRTQVIKNHEEEKKQMKAEFDLAMSKALDEKAAIIADYENRLMVASEKYKADLTRVNAEYKLTMQSIYSDMQNIQSISEVSEEPVEQTEDTYGINGVYSYQEPPRRMVA